MKEKKGAGGGASKHGWHSPSSRKKKKKGMHTRFCMCMCACHEVCLEFDSTSSAQVGWPWEDHCHCTLPTVSGSTPQLTFDFNPSAVHKMYLQQEVSFFQSYLSTTQRLMKSAQSLIKIRPYFELIHQLLTWRKQSRREDSFLALENLLCTFLCIFFGASYYPSCKRGQVQTHTYSVCMYSISLQFRV